MATNIAKKRPKDLDAQERMLLGLPERKRFSFWRFFKRASIALVALLVIVIVAGGGYVAWWVSKPLQLSSPSIEFTVAQGSGLRAAAESAIKAGVQEPSILMVPFFRLAARGHTIKPGDYAITSGMKPFDLIDKLMRGDRIVLTITFIEGWNFAQARKALNEAAGLRHDTLGQTNQQIMKALGREGVEPEGRFFPDTFHYYSSSSDMEILRDALHEMDQHLQAAWSQRAPDTPLKAPDDALKLASLIEKETGSPADRALIAGVFINRLRKDMPLQTDPSVIYGLGDKYTGSLTRANLQTDSPWNTYMHRGLPPTPIALPGQASLMAAVQPAPTQALYFVSRGDGTSEFSQTLEEHNRAVQKFQRSGASH